MKTAVLIEPQPRCATVYVRLQHRGPTRVELEKYLGNYTLRYGQQQFPMGCDLEEALLTGSGELPFKLSAGLAWTLISEGQKLIGYQKLAVRKVRR